MEEVHRFLDAAKGFRWNVVFDMLSKSTPDLLNAMPKGRWSVLHQAAFSGNKMIVLELLQLGANPNIENSQGHKPHDIASQRGFIELANLLKNKLSDDAPYVNEVELLCTKKTTGKREKLVVRVITKGYSQQLNCQFPRKIRSPGALFKTSSNNILLRRRKKKYFYMYTGPKDITPSSHITVYDDGADSVCAICMDAAPDSALAPCGHAQFCNQCISKLITCPICKKGFKTAILITMIE